jgi:hypothetical protein
MNKPALVSMPVEFRLTHPDGVEVQPLWLVLATLRKHGFRTLAPIVRSGLAGSWLLATAVYQNARHEAGGAMRAAMQELRYADALAA